MSRLKPRGSYGDEPGLILGAIALLVLVPAMLLWVPLALAEPAGYDGGGPIAAMIALWQGEVTWTVQCTLYASAELAVMLLAALLLWWVRQLGKKRGSRVDWAARRMATSEDLAKLTPAGVAESARRLRPAMAVGAPPDEHGGRSAPR